MSHSPIRIALVEGDRFQHLEVALRRHQESTETTVKVVRRQSLPEILTIVEDEAPLHLLNAHSRYTADPLFRDQNQLPLLQIQNTYIICETNGGFLLIHQQSAHERVLYEQFMHAVTEKPLATQPGLFPSTISLSTPDAVLLLELLPDLRALVYFIEPFGKGTYIIQGTPAGFETGSEKKVIE